MTHEINPIFVKVASGQTTSAPFYVGNAEHLAVIFPAAMTGTTIEIQVSHHPTTGFVSIKTYSSTGYKVTFAGFLGGAFNFSEEDRLMHPYSFLRIVCDSAQAADRTLIFIGKCS